GGGMQAAMTDGGWQRNGNRHPARAPCSSFRCSVGDAMLAEARERQGRRIWHLIDREDLANDPRRATIPAREANDALVEELIAEWINELSMREVVSTLNAEGISCSPILSFGEIVKEEHFRVRESVDEVQHPTAGKLTHYGTTPKFSRTRTRI